MKIDFKVDEEEEEEEALLSSLHYCAMLYVSKRMVASATALLLHIAMNIAPNFNSAKIGGIIQ